MRMRRMTGEETMLLARLEVAQRAAKSWQREAEDCEQSYKTQHATVQRLEDALAAEKTMTGAWKTLFLWAMKDRGEWVAEAYALANVLNALPDDEVSA